jgi:hypothetical protein
MKYLIVARCMEPAKFLEVSRKAVDEKAQVKFGEGGSEMPAPCTTPKFIRWKFHPLFLVQI